MTDLPHRNECLAGRYLLEAVVGEGGMATVYRARDLHHQRVVAVKIVNEDIAARLGAWRFLREIKVTGRLTHPNILPLHDSGVVGATLFLVTPFLTDGSLRQLLESEQQLPLEQALRLAAEIAEGLAYAHESGVVHRDIKPANVLLERGHAVVCDFGLAKAAWAEGSAASSPGLAVGTPLYMSPEQAAATGPLDGRSDVYSLACVLFEMLAGKPPFSDGLVDTVLRRKVSEPPPRLRSLRPSAPEDLERLVQGMLAPAPGDRPKAAECAAALQTLAVHCEAQSATRPGLPRRPKRRTLALSGAAVVVTIGLVLWVRAAITGPGTLLPTRVVVGLFENQTGDRGLDHLGGMAIDWITHGLQLANVGDVVPTATALSVSRYVAATTGRGGELDPIRALAEETGSGLVISGTFQAQDTVLRVTVQISRLNGARVETRALEPEVGPLSQAHTVIDRLRQRVMGALAARFDSRLAGVLGPSSSPPTYSAYRAFSRGLEAYIEDDREAATTLFREAFADDSTFLPSLLFLALNHSNLGHWAVADSILTIVDRRRGELSPYDAAWLDYRKALIAGRRSEALEAVRRAADIAPESKASYNHAYEAYENGNLTEAVEALTRLAPERGPMRGWLPYWWLMADIQHCLDRLADERTTASRAAALYGGRPDFAALPARVAAAGGDTGAAYGAIRSAEWRSRRPADAWVAAAYLNVADELRAHGHSDHARAAYANVAARFEHLDPASRAASHERLVSAWGLYHLGKFDAAARRLDSTEVEELIAIELHGLRGLVAVSGGDSARARLEWAWLESQPSAYRFGAPAFYQARMAALGGDRDRALGKLGEAFRQGRHYGLWVHETAEFHLLRDTPAFREVIGSR